MKTIASKTALAFAGIIFVMTGCSNKNDDSVTPDNTSGKVTQGNWKVSYFNDSDSDETYKFNGYTFTFATSGSVTATNGTDTRTGTWSTGNDDSTVKMYLTFTGGAPFDEITDDWHVTEQSDSVIKLTDVSGGNGGTDYLHFAKI